jgi:hypothetical protein
VEFTNGMEEEAGVLAQIFKIETVFALKQRALLRLRNSLTDRQTNKNHESDIRDQSLNTIITRTRRTHLI